jgi:hypothetical protein
MKTVIALLSAVVFSAGITGSATGQTGAAPAATPDRKVEEKRPMPTESKTVEKKATPRTAHGAVKSASAASLVVTGKDKGKDAEWTFAVDAKTSVKKAGKSVGAADLKAGDPVQVRYTEQDGKAMAQAVVVKAPGTEKKEATASKKTEKK